MTHEVRGVVARSKGAPVSLETVLVPDPGPGEALVRVQACGVCHTDLHYRQGAINDDFPFLLGHEAAGVVDAVGADVTSVAPGDFVVLNWRAVCGQCRSCRRGRPWSGRRRRGPRVSSGSSSIMTVATRRVTGSSRLEAQGAAPRVRACHAGIGDDGRDAARWSWRAVSFATDDDGNGGAVAVTGMANLAVKVRDLDAACAFYEAAGAQVRDRMAWNGAERADVYLGPVMITLFTRAIYEDSVELPPEGFLHPALFTDDLDAELEGHTVVWGPAVVEGAFGTRRIAFVDAPGGIRLEFMEQLEPPAATP